MPEVCKICENSGMQLVERVDGVRVAKPCECRDTRRGTRLLEAVKIPKRYAEATFDNYETTFKSADKALESALRQLKSFAERYPHSTNGKGLLLTGSNGTGKTHLAIALAKVLVGRGHQCLFVTYDDLLKQVRHTYNPAVQQTELDVLQPMVEAEVLIIDELGSSKPTDWVRDTVAHVLNTRYNDMRCTIITTNFVNNRELLEGDVPAGSPEARAAWLAMYKENLGDRIGERMRSRLQEMCTIVEVTSVDFRDSVNRHKRSVDPPQVRPVVEKKVPVIADVEEPPVVGGARLGSRAKRVNVSGTD